MADSLAAVSDKAFGARDATKELNTQLEAIRNKKIRAEVEVVITTTQDAVDAAVAAARRAANRTPAGGDFRFAGGPVDAGHSYVVGEIGPELFVPKTGNPYMVGQGGPEVRDFATSGFVVPNHLVGTDGASLTVPDHLLGVAGGTTTVIRERVEIHDAKQPLVGTMVVGSGHEHDAMAELERMALRQARIARERE